MTDDLLSLAEAARTQLTGPEQAVWLHRLESAYDRLAGRLADCLQANRFEEGLSLCVCLGHFWWMVGRAAQGRQWLSAFLAQPPADPALHARALAAAGGVAYAQADYFAARSFFTQALALAEEQNDFRGRAEAHNNLGMVDRERGAYDQAQRHHEAALQLFREQGETWGAAAALSNLGVVALFAGRPEEALPLHEQALALRRELQDQRGIASSLGNLANVHLLHGDVAQAETLHQQALNLRRELGDRWGVAGSLLNLGIVAGHRGDFPAAHRMLTEAQAAFQSVGDALGLCECLDAFAELAFREGKAALAVSLFARARLRRLALGAPLPAIHRRAVEHALQRLREMLGPTAFEAAAQPEASSPAG